jgi:hypothetical protein
MCLTLCCVGGTFLFLLFPLVFCLLVVLFSALSGEKVSCYSFVIFAFTLYFWCAVLYLPSWHCDRIVGVGGVLCVLVSNQRLTVSQYILISSPLWDFWPDIASCSRGWV